MAKRSRSRTDTDCASSGKSRGGVPGRPRATPKRKRGIRPGRRDARKRCVYNLQWSHVKEGEELWWFVDGVQCGKTVGLEPFVLQMEKGEHFDKDFLLELNLPKGEYFINRTIVNEAYGNPWKTWIQMGRPRFTSKKQVEILRNAARPLVISERVSCAEDILLLEFTQSKNEVSFFEIIPVTDETDTYYKLDDSMIPGY